MWDAVKEIIGSKKALYAFLSIVIWLFGKVGLDLDIEVVGPAVVPLWVLIWAQGKADQGKEAEKQRAKNAAAASTTPAS